MSSISVENLKNKKRILIANITNARDEINACEDNYDSLVKFKSIVQDSQEEFTSAGVLQKQIIDQIKPYYEFNNSAKMYGEEVSDFVDSIGTKIVGKSYDVLIGLINLAMQKNYNRISELNDKIIDWKDRIEDIDKEITYQSSN